MTTVELRMERQDESGGAPSLPNDVADVVRAAAAAEALRESPVLGSTSPGVLVHLDGDNEIWRESSDDRRDRLKVSVALHCSPPTRSPALLNSKMFAAAAGGGAGTAVRQ